jgi:hypothetical protein
VIRVNDGEQLLGIKVDFRGFYQGAPHTCLCRLSFSVRVLAIDSHREFPEFFR